jgi:protoporphyrinogen oxidase
MGLAVAYELTLQGLEPVILEADNRLGGMAASFQFAGLALERYYHFHCLSDRDFFAILKELRLSDRLHWRHTRMGFFCDRRLYRWGSVGAVLSFPRLPLSSRIRYLAHAARCLTIGDWRRLDELTATTWLRRWLGERGYQMLWHKLFAYKFFHHGDSISAAWIWSRIRRLGQSRQWLQETLGFLEGGSQTLIDAMEQAIRTGGGQVRLSSPVLALKPRPEGGALLTTADGEEGFDQVISTIPLPLLAPILEAGGAEAALVQRYRDQPPWPAPAWCCRPTNRSPETFGPT